VIAEEGDLALHTVRDLERAYSEGELDTLKAAILPFIRSHREKLAEFIRNFQRIEGPTSLDVMVKIFILQNNMPFDLKDYLHRQTNLIEKEIGPCCDSKERRQNVAEWVRQKAADHRSSSMFQQVYCFERLKQELIPLIEAELNLHNAHCN